MKLWLRKRFINFLTAHLFNTISEEDILYLKGSKYYYKGKPLDEERLERIRQSADVFADSLLWDILSSEVKYQLNRQMYYKEQSNNDLLMVKAGLHVLNIIERTLQRLKKEHADQ